MKNGLLMHGASADSLGSIATLFFTMTRWCFLVGHGLGQTTYACLNSEPFRHVKPVTSYARIFQRFLALNSTEFGVHA